MHSFRESLSQVARRHKTITVYATQPHEDLIDQFAERNATIVHRPLPEGYEVEFVVVSENEQFLGTMNLDTLGAMTTPPINPPWNPPQPALKRLFELLDDTVFASFDRRQMLAAAREIEERAWRINRGTLFTGFQRLSAMQAQLGVYRRLATETDLDVHVFGHADWRPPPISGATVHAETTAEIADFWFLLFDGGGDDLLKCALVAEERSRGAFYGFWTYDSTLVDELVEYVRETYVGR